MTDLKRYLIIGVVALSLSLVVQRYVEQRRVEQNLIWTDPQKKEALESGFMALGGFRGLLVDILWVRANRLQDSARYYELKLLCDLIQKLQPSFTQVHAFLAFNMSYNLAFHAVSPEDKWYWITSGLATLEKGLERNRHHYGLWFELGMQYADRLSDIKIGPCKALRDAGLPRIDEVPEDQRATIFLKRNWTPGHARDKEHIRWAAYYFYQAGKATGDPMPLRSERMFGHCLDWLGHYRANTAVPKEKREWSDWGSEDWWIELTERNKARGFDWDDTVPQCLNWSMLDQIDVYLRESERLKASDPVAAATHARHASEAEKRFRQYFPDEKKSLSELMEQHRKKAAEIRATRERGGV